MGDFIAKIRTVLGPYILSMTTTRIQTGHSVYLLPKHSESLVVTTLLVGLTLMRPWMLGLTAHMQPLVIDMDFVDSFNQLP